jgi:hypothetical protein
VSEHVNKNVALKMTLRLKKDLRRLARIAALVPDCAPRRLPELQ